MSFSALPTRPVVGPSCFPLAKFSFATVSGDFIKPIPWTHVSDKRHLFAVFENISLPTHDGNYEEKSHFKVLAEPEVMEDLDLKALGHEATKAAHEMRTLPSPPKFPAVTIIIQEPCIAVRFPLQYGQIRRFQMKFKLGSDFYKALSLFSQAGCPFTQAGSPPSQGHTSRPLTTSSAVGPATETSRPKKCSPSAPSTASSDQRTLVPSVRTSMHSSSRPSTSSSSVWKPEAQSSAYLKSSNDNIQSITNCEKHQVSPNFPGPRTRLSTSEDGFSGYDKRNAASTKASEDNSFMSLDPVGAVARAAVCSTTSTLQPVSPMAAHRPSTAPAFDSQRLPQMLPPRRELPFKVPRAASETGRKISKITKSPCQVLEDISDTVASASIAAPIGDSEQCTDHEASEKSKITVAKRATTANRRIRNATASSCSRNKPSVTEEDSPVPSVEELLRRSETLFEKKDGINRAANEADRASVLSIGPAAPKSRVCAEGGGLTESLATSVGHHKQPEEYQTTYQHSTIDTQSLLARVDERQRLKQNKRKDASQIHEEPLPLPPSKRIASDALLESVCLPPPNQGAQMPLLRRISAEAASMSKGQSGIHDNYPFLEVRHLDVACRSDLRENDGVPSSAEDPLKMASATLVNRGRSSDQEPSVLADNPNVASLARPHTSASSTVMALMNDPNFARSPEVAQWSDLPPEERDAVLETWMCEQLESESFAKLLKTLEGMWQRIFFGR